MKKFTKSLVLCFFVLLLGSRCGESDSPDDTSIASSISILAGSQFTGSVNQTFQLDIRVLDEDGEEIFAPDVLWTSEDQQVATVTNSGALVLKSAGETLITATSGEVSDSKNVSVTIRDDVIAFSANNLSIDLAQGGGESLTFLDESTMTGTYLEYEIGASTAASSSSNDEVYYFMTGAGKMLIGSEEIVIAAGSAIFIASDIERSITSVTTTMSIVHVRLKRSFSQAAPSHSVFTSQQMEATRSTSQNVWNPFLNERSVIFGLYMLPRTLGGDGRLVHGFDELNIIVSGSSSFQTDAGTVSVEEGAIVFVREGNGHFFRSLAADIDILILWNK